MARGNHAGADPKGAANPVKSPPIQQNPASVRPGMAAPLFPVVDRNDPLHPANLASRSMDAQQVIDTANSIRRTARNLGREPGWPPILHKLQTLETEYRQLTMKAISHHEQNQHYYQLIQSLPMDNLENIQALMEIEAALEQSLKTWNDCYSTLSAIVTCIHPTTEANA